MERKMGKVKSFIIMVEYNLKENIKMEKEMDLGKNIIEMVVLNM